MILNQQLQDFKINSKGVSNANNGFKSVYNVKWLKVHEVLLGNILKN